MVCQPYFNKSEKKVNSKVHMLKKGIYVCLKRVGAYDKIFGLKKVIY